MSLPNPALVTQRAVGALPRAALWLFCAAYVLPGVFGRDPWRNADLSAFGYMASIAEGRSSWFAPALGGVAADAALLPHWLGAAFIQLLGPWTGAALAARVPFALLLALTLALTWYATFHLARTEDAQPMPLAFGGEAATLDYARALADAAVLALIACLGLMQLGHETTPELAQLCGVGLLLWAAAAAPFRRWRGRGALWLALSLMALSGAPAMACGLGLGTAAVCALSDEPARRRFAPWALLGTALAALLALWAGTWAWRTVAPQGAAAVLATGRLWLWFLWPAWPLALWTLWRWRRQLQQPHLALPLVTAATGLVASAAMGGSDRALMLALPALAMLAAFALPTMQRSVAAAIDWFSMCFFSLGAIVIWVIYVSIHTGVPRKPAVNVSRLVEGFQPSFSLLALLLALAGTAAWIWLLRWRTGRQREALWKSLLLPAGGAALWWLLAMSLWLPLLDSARSSRTVVSQLAAQVPADDCLAAPGMATAGVAAFETLGRLKVDAVRPLNTTACAHLVIETRANAARGAPAGWELVKEVRRPTDREGWVSLYRRTAGR